MVAALLAGSNLVKALIYDGKVSYDFYLAQRLGTR